MSGDLDLSLPQRTEKAKGGSKVVVLLLVLLLAVGTLNLVLSLRSGPKEEPTHGTLSSEATKELALRLEKQALRTQAIEAWKEYLQTAAIGSEERAKVWYRMGKLAQEAGQYDQALTCYYRSEAFAKLDDLADEIGRRTQECLEAAGRFAALRYELADRVGVGKEGEGAGGEVVAEIGPQKITKADLDRMIEEEIDQQLAQLGPLLPPEEQKRQKEAMLKQFSSAPQRLAMLNQMLAEELLYRKARESKLADSPETQALLRNLEKKVLAQQALEAELADKVKIMPGDLETYYEAHKSEYVQPEQAQISHILLEDEAEANEILDKLKAGEDFEKAAKEHSHDEATKESGGRIDGWVEKGSFIPGIGRSDEAAAAIFATEAGHLVDQPVKTDQGFHLIKVRQRRPERQKTLDEVRAEVARSLRARKERDVQEALMAQLRERYDVVIHHSRFAEQEEARDTAENKKPD